MPAGGFDGDGAASMSVKRNDLNRTDGLVLKPRQRGSSGLRLTGRSFLAPLRLVVR